MRNGHWRDHRALGHVTADAGLPRSLTPNAFKAELSWLVGIETAEELFREITQDDFFLRRSADKCKTAVI